MHTWDLLAQADRLGLKVGSRSCYIRQMNRVNSHNGKCHDDSTMNIGIGITIIIILYYYYYYFLYPRY